MAEPAAQAVARAAVAGKCIAADDIPNAGLALIYAPTPDAYFAQVYIGIQTGIYFYITEIVDPSASANSRDPATNSVYGSEGIKEIAVTVAEKISEALGLPGFTFPIIISSLVLLATASILIKKKRN